MFRSFFRKKICISFDWHHDRHYRHLLSALIANPGSAIDFEDLTPGEINTNSVSQVKRVLRTQIRSSTHLLVIVGAYANSPHKDSKLIGTRNWQWWEIEAAKEEGKRLIAVKIEPAHASPTPLMNAGAKWAMSYTVPAILKAISEA